MPTVKCKNCGAVHSISVTDSKRGVVFETCALCPPKKQGKVEKVTETREKGKRMFGGYGVDDEVVEVKK